LGRFELIYLNILKYSNLGLDAVKQGRVMLGATNPLASAPGTIRGNYCVETGRNICHGSDSVYLKSFHN